jgi:hypothetical protein
MTTNNTIALISEQQWLKKHAMLPPDAIALFSFLLTVANGRPRFTASIEALRKMTSRCSRNRFMELARRLEQEGLIKLEWSRWDAGRDWRKVEQAAEPDVWTIKENPHWRVTKLADGELFYIPAQNLQLAPAKRERRSPAAERMAYMVAKASCEKRGRAFAYPNLETFLKEVGARPPGEFLSGRSRYALFRQDDVGHYGWREKSTR